MKSLLLCVITFVSLHSMAGGSQVDSDGNKGRNWCEANEVPVPAKVQFNMGGPGDLDEEFVFCKDKSAQSGVFATRAIRINKVLTRFYKLSGNYGNTLILVDDRLVNPYNRSSNLGQMITVTPLKSAADATITNGLEISFHNDNDEVRIMTVPLK